MIAAIDIGGTKIAVGMVDGGGRVVRRWECPTAAERGFEHGAQRIVRMLRDCARDAGAEITGIGVGSTGPIDPFTGVYGRDNLLGWDGANLIERLRRDFAEVPIIVENDADAAALAEAAWGVGRGKERFVFVTISTGIGGGIVIGGELFRGIDGAHPEVGHHVIEASGPACYCGGRGCWEMLASGPAMAAWARENAAPGISLPDDLSAKEICRRAEHGEDWARRAVEREAFYIGVGVANLLMVLSPDGIALGGGLMGSAHLFMDRVLAVVRTNCAFLPSEKVDLRVASLGADAVLVGAARALQNRTGETRPTAMIDIVNTT